MLLYLVRHGEALPDSSDDQRRLSHQGIKDVRAVAHFLKEKKVHILAIYHSTKTRARQTAELLSADLQTKKNLIEKAGMGPSDPVKGTADLIDQQRKDVMFVGHMPFMGDLVSLLITGELGRNIVSFPTAGVVILEKSAKTSWVIRDAISPKML